MLYSITNTNGVQVIVFERLDKFSLQSVQILKHLYNNVVRVLKYQSQQQLHHIMQILLLHRARKRYRDMSLRIKYTLNFSHLWHSAKVVQNALQFYRVNCFTLEYQVAKNSQLGIISLHRSEH